MADMQQKKVLVVYATKRGTTGDVAGMVAKRLDGAVELYNARSGRLFRAGAAEGDGKKPPAGFLGGYDLIVVGTPMYIGEPLSQIKQLCARQEQVMGKAGYALFTCGIGTQEEDEKFIKNHLPAMFIEKATSYRHLGGEVRLERMNVLARGIFKNMPSPGIDHAAIDEFCGECNAALNRVEE